jgi:hypothetical protein
LKDFISAQETSHKKPLTVFVFGDLNAEDNDPEFDDEVWQMFVQDFKSTPNAVAIGLGDYGDWLRPSMRAKIQGALNGDSSAQHMIDDMVRLGQDKLLRRLEFMKGKLIGLHDGHHQWDFADGTNSTQRLCAALKAPYLGWIASTRIALTTYGQTFRVWTLVSTHGNGTAKTTTADAGGFERTIVNGFVADGYVRGHGCKSAAWLPYERIHIRRKGPAGRDRQVPRAMIIGGFKKGYTDGWNSSYVEKAGFISQPRSYGKIVLGISEHGAHSEAKGLRKRVGAHQTPNLTVSMSVHGQQTDSVLTEA